MLATTKQFLDYFDLKKLSDLPPLSEIKDYDQINPDLFEGMEQVLSAVEEKAAAAARPTDIAETAETEEEELQQSNVIPFSG